MARIHPSVGEGEVNSYQRRVGLVFGATALLILLISSGAQSTIGYAQFAYAYAQTTQKCPNFPTPVGIMTQYITGEAAFSNLNSSSKWDSHHTYIKSFSVSGLGLNETNLSFTTLSMTVLTTRERFYNNSGQIVKDSSENITTTVAINGFNAHIATYQAQITVKQVSGTYRVNNAAFTPVTMTGSAENIRVTITCEGGNKP